MNLSPMNTLHNQAKRFFSQGKFDLAINACYQILNDHPRHAESHFMLGLINGNKENYTKARICFERAIACDGNQPVYFAQLSHCLILLGYYLQAYDVIQLIKNKEITDPIILDTIGCVFTHLEKHQEAEHFFEKAVEFKPDNHDFVYNLAICKQYLGKTAEAENLFEQSIKQEPKSFKSYWSLSSLKKQTKGANHIQKWENVLSTNKENPRAKTYLHFALAKEYEDIQEDDEAIRHLKEGCAIRREHIDFSIEKERKIFDAIKENFNAEYFQEKYEFEPSNEPIFIIGMPRTGTTLVDRILSSHSSVFSAGELKCFGVAAKRLASKQVNTPNFIDQETMIAAKNVKPVDIGKRYIDSTRYLTSGCTHFIDKLPFNFLYLGLIRQALPNAKIIHLQRNPMDTCFSNYKQLFAKAYFYSYDLRELGQYYLLYMDLMNYWNSLFGDRILNIAYEQLIENPREQTGRLLEFCGLSWQDNCLNFHDNTSAVSTASSAQVRQPIYKDSLQKWRRFEKHLVPLRETLEAGGIVID